MRDGEPLPERASRGRSERARGPRGRPRSHGLLATRSQPARGMTFGFPSMSFGRGSISDTECGLRRPRGSLRWPLPGSVGLDRKPSLADGGSGAGNGRPLARLKPRHRVARAEIPARRAVRRRRHRVALFPSRDSRDRRGVNSRQRLDATRHGRPEDPTCREQCNPRHADTLSPAGRRRLRPGALGPSLDGYSSKESGPRAGRQFFEKSGKAGFVPMQAASSLRPLRSQFRQLGPGM